MLRLIRIRNLALIRELEIEFGNGLNLLTGETDPGSPFWSMRSDCFWERGPRRR